MVLLAVRHACGRSPCPPRRHAIKSWKLYPWAQARSLGLGLALAQIDLGGLQHFLGVIVLDEGDDLEVLEIERPAVFIEFFLRQIVIEALFHLRQIHDNVLLRSCLLEGRALDATL